MITGCQVHVTMAVGDEEHDVCYLEQHFEPELSCSFNSTVFLYSLLIAVLPLLS